jgi:hypothetical protein
MAEKNAFMFLCDVSTEVECLAKHLVGTTQSNALWAMRVKAGDDIYLFNFQTGQILGPYLANSGADCHDAAAWGGNFPIQVRISKTDLTKRANNRAPGAPALLRKSRPYGDIGTGEDLRLWLQACGADF